MQSSSALPVWRGALYVAIAATAWGTGGAVATAMYDAGGIGPVAVTFWRFLAGVVLLLAAHTVRRARRPEAVPPLRAVYAGNPRRALITGIGMAMAQTAYFAAVQQAGLAVGTVATLGAGPVLVAVGARLTLGERAGAAGIAAVVCGVAGLALLMGGADGTTGPDPLRGIGYAMFSAVGYAGVTLLGRFSGRGPGGVFESTVPGFTVGMLCLLPLAWWEGLVPGMDRPAVTLGLILYLGAVPTALAYILLFTGLRVVRATTASVIALVDPLAAAAIGVLAFGERLNAIVLTGTALLLFAVVFLAVHEGSGRPSPSVATEPERGRGRRAPRQSAGAEE
ncbi:membrane protein [Streptomyces varsoviensis]|uniref:Membrane protein n=1 Tax=Streptomyces varsoviensis TaxID=67373 RepID=A0ABR5J604_9ACTN|nr:membrane protein [Streptomyces varsoviensis]